MIRPHRVILGHKRMFAAIAVGMGAWFLLPAALGAQTRAITAWDVGAVVFLLLAAALFTMSPPERMEANADAQEEGEWTLFWIVLLGAAASFYAVIVEFGKVKAASASEKGLIVAAVAATLLLTWLLIQAVFALRYAHEYYSGPDGAPIDKGLEFPGEMSPDYWDFFYFSAVLGMTFQVSDVQITSRKLRRLATLHGLLGFLFNTVIVALTVNLAASLL